MGWFSSLFASRDVPTVGDPGPEKDHNADSYKRIMELCRVAGVSFAVVHEGRVMAELSGGRGHQDATDPSSPVPDTNSMYTMASVSKLFVAIAVGILVHEGKLELDQPITKYVPEFVPKEDPRVGNEATLEDFLRHSSGLDNPVVSLLGPQGKSVVSADDFIGVLNDTPNTWYGKRYFRFWCYSNVAFGLVALAIERVTNVSFSRFVQERILDPLGMKHTAVRSSQLENECLVHAGAQLSDGTWQGLDHDWTSEENTPILAMVGMRSSPGDLLILCCAFMDAQDPDSSEAGFELLPVPEANPLRPLRPLLQEDKWIFPGPKLKLFDNEMRFHFGWARVVMPSAQSFWGAWTETSPPPSSVNPVDDAETTPVVQKGVLGADSGSRVTYKATGISFCGTVSVNIFPESRTTVVVCSSGLNCGDAANFIAALLIQKVFDLAPKLDILAWAENEEKFQIAKFDNNMKEFNENKDISKPEACHDDYVGEYYGFGIKMIVRKPTSGGLELCFNNREDIVHPLRHFAEDRYSYGPETRDEWLKDGWLDWDYYLVGILAFQRNEETHEIVGFTWVWERDAKPHPFKKV